ncbi:CHAT domain-containing protein, partial [Longimicrobium sp.]|uniref:CHAT domain-containing protein n=1 Tax=Longimicrobium sp. TaxID=2029185 RepID=UPI002E366ACD
FLVVGGLRSVEQARRLLDETSARHLVIALGDAPDYYLVSARDFEERTAGADGSAPLQESGLTHARHAVPVRSRAGAMAGRETCLVMEDGVLAGVFEPGRLSGRDTRFMLTDQALRHSRRGDGTASRYLRAEMPGETTVGQTVLLEVEVGADPSPLPVDLPGGAALEVVVLAREGFEVEGNDTTILSVSVDGGAPAHARFRLRAVRPGPGVVRVFALHGGRFLGALPRLETVIHPAAEAGPDAAPAPVLRAAGALGAGPSAAPDLSLLIVEQRDALRGPSLSIRATARDAALRLTHKEFGPVPLGMEPLRYFEDFFADIEEIGHRPDYSPALVARKLEGKGTRLFESIFPAELRALLWEHRHRIASVQIYSEEAWIPWELCRLTGMQDGKVVEGPFFCEAFEITRWIPGVPGCPWLTLDNLALVMPRDPRLPAVREEREFLLSLAAEGGAVSEIPARYLDVRRALATGSFDGFHFSGHGVRRGPNADRSSIVLEAREDLRADEISGDAHNLGRSQPLVFLNSCHGARGAFTLVGAGGWARQFLEAGAGAFVGAYWSISDKTASAFSRAFYRELRAGKGLGAAVRAARLAIRSDNDPTWLAYTVYGDPGAAVR